MKKVLFLTMFFIFALPFIKGSAATYGEPCIKFNQDTYYFSLETQANTTIFTYKDADNVTRNYIKPVMVYRNNILYLISKPMTGGIYQTWGNNNQYNSTNNGGGVIVPLSTSYTLYNTPMFNDFVNASKYSCGEEFDTSHLIGGFTVQSEFDDSSKYSIDVNGFDSQLKFSYDGKYFTNDVSFFYQWKETPTVPSDCDRVFIISFSYLNKSTLETLYYNYSVEGLSWQTLCAVFNTIFNSGASGNIDYSDSMLTTTFSFDLDKTLNNSLYENYIDYSYDEDDGKHSIKWTELDLTPGTYTYDLNPYGILNFLTNYYGDLKKALFSLSYVSFNYIDSFVVKYTTMVKKVYDWYNTYYIDLKKSDGTVYEHRSFNTKNSIDNNDINPNPPTNTIGGGGEDIPNVILPSEERQSSYNQSIQDSYNNIVNNYYYNNNYNNSILDYYNSFTDGGTDEDINDALGYVKSTLGSLTHIPILLGMCFTGFLPSEVILLFNALLIVFVVFLIVRIIKHLFTH